MSHMRTGSRAKWLKGKFESHERELVRYVFSLTNDLDTAREVVQESFLKLCEEDQRKVDKRVRAWLYAVCRNKALDIMKKERKMVKKPLDEVEDSFSSHPLDNLQNRQDAFRQAEPASWFVTKGAGRDSAEISKRDELQADR